MKSIVYCLLTCAVLAGCGSASKEQEPAKSPTATAPATDSASAAAATDPAASSSAPKVGDKAKCPVSGEEFTVAENSPKVTHEGKDYYFCCQGCADEFKADPQKFVK